MSKIGIITDLHFGEDISGKMKEGINTYGETFHLLEKMRDEIVGSVDCLINMGDLVFGSSRESKLGGYQFLQDNFISKLPFPVYSMLGNHEFFIADPESIQKILGSMLRKSFVYNGVKNILLDISFNLENLFEISQETISWLKKELEFEGEIVIYCHFPISEDQENVSYYHAENNHKAFLQNSGELRELLIGTNCRYWVSGHTHFEFSKEIDGIQHVTIPSLSEDNNGSPNAKYAVFDTETMSLEIHTVKI